jgi:hypothetical protein
MGGLMRGKIMRLLTLLLIVGLSETARANQVLFGPPHTVTVNGTSTQYLPANTLRTYLIIQNAGAVNVIVKFGGVQTGSEGVVIGPGGNYEPIKAPANSVYMISASSTASVTLVEGQ